MKRLLLIPLLLLLFAVPADADIYKYTDSDGKVHFVDDIHKIPDEYRRGAEIVETKPLNILPADEGGPVTPAATAPAAEGKEIYGDQTLDWWENQITNLRKKVSNYEELYKSKEDYISVFESGRRFGQIYTAEEVEKYEKFKGELPKDEKRLKEAWEKLDKLIWKARKAGVPRKVRGD